MLLIFGGLRMHVKSLQRYAELHGRNDALFIPFKVKDIWFSPDFENVNAQICNKKLTIHCLSGGPCNYSRMLVQHPNLCKNVQFEVFDNPTSFNGLYNRYKILQGIALSKNMQDQIDYIFKKPLTEAKKLIIVSSKDDISAGDAENLAAAWNVKNVWYNDAKHLHSIKTYKSIYKEKINDIYGQ